MGLILLNLHMLKTYSDYICKNNHGDLKIRLGSKQIKAFTECSAATNYGFHYQRILRLFSQLTDSLFGLLNVNIVTNCPS